MENVNVIDTVAGYGCDIYTAMHRMQEEAVEKKCTVKQNLNGVMVLINAVSKIQILYSMWKLIKEEIIIQRTFHIGPEIEKGSLEYKTK